MELSTRFAVYFYDEHRTAVQLEGNDDKTPHGPLVVFSLFALYQLAQVDRQARLPTVHKLRSAADGKALVGLLGEDHTEGFPYLLEPYRGATGTKGFTGSIDLVDPGVRRMPLKYEQKDIGFGWFDSTTSTYRTAAPLVLLAFLTRRARRKRPQLDALARVARSCGAIADAGSLTILNKFDMAFKALLDAGIA